MPFIIADRVREISTTVGTGSIALGGAVVGFQTFDAVLDTGDTTYYTFAEQGGPNWEVGIGTFTAPSTLARTTILSSSNAGSIVNFGAGTKNVFITLPASRTNVEDQPNIIEVNSSSPALRINQIGTGNALLVEDSANPDATPFVVDASGNVGVGTTTPTAPLDVNGNVAITGTARRITGDFSNGTFNSRTLFQSSSGTFSDVGVIGPNASQSASWAAYFGNDPANTSRARMLATSVDARFESSATGTGTLLPMTFFTGGSERMRIDASGNVGIGTSSPIGRLSVNLGDASGNVSAWDSTYATFGAAGSTTGKAVGVGFNATSNYGEIRSVEPGVAWRDLYIRGNNLNFYSSISGASVLGMVLNTSGNVGIGTSSPGARLHVSGSSGITTQIIQSTGSVAARFNLQTTNDANGFINYDTGNWIFFNNSAGSAVERMRIDASGNVGIGTSSPGSLLQLNKGSGAADIRLSVAGTLYGTMYASSSDMTINSITAIPLTFGTNNTERMRIDASGNVGIGTSSPGVRLDVQTPGGTATRLRWLQAGVTNYEWQIPASVDAFALSYGGTIERMRIDASGNVGIGTSSPAERLDVNGNIFLRPASPIIYTGGTLSIQSGSASPLVFLTNAGTERFRFGPSGQFGIGGANYGTSGQVLTSTGSGSAPSWQSATATGTLVNVQVFTSSGTYTRTAGVTRAVVIAVGGGGGAGGAGSSSGNGGAGGTTSFGSQVTALGGSASLAGGNSALGGTGGTGATIAIRGAPGAQGLVSNLSSRGGTGGGQGGGIGGAATNNAGGAGVRGGGGGGGVGTVTIGCDSFTVSSGGGGQGETAIDYIASGLNATETVTIGAGGTGGSAPSGGAGGAGGAGYVIVYEYS